MSLKSANHRSAKSKGRSNGHKPAPEANLGLSSEALQPGLGLSEPLELEREQARNEEIWARRAAQLAQAPVAVDSSEQIELVMVRLGCEIYGIEVEYVSSIRPLEQVTRVPRVPAWMAGVTNLRGNILSVLDLQKFFGLAGSNPGQVLVVVKTWEMELAILVDEVLAIESIPVGQIQPTNDILHGIRPEYVRGVAERSRDEDQDEVGDDLLLVLDLPALLADPQLIINEDVL